MNLNGPTPLDYLSILVDENVEFTKEEHQTIDRFENRLFFDKFLPSKRVRAFCIATSFFLLGLAGWTKRSKSEGFPFAVAALVLFGFGVYYDRHYTELRNKHFVVKNNVHSRHKKMEDVFSKALDLKINGLIKKWNTGNSHKSAVSDIEAHVCEKFKELVEKYDKETQETIIVEDQELVVEYALLNTFAQKIPNIEFTLKNKATNKLIDVCQRYNKIFSTLNFSENEKVKEINQAKKYTYKDISKKFLLTKIDGPELQMIVWKA